MPDSLSQIDQLPPDQPSPGDDDCERLTIIARDATPAALEFHRQRLGEQGYSIAGRIERHRFQLVDGPGRPSDLFSGSPFYAATFIRTNSGKSS